ncbi:glycosyltransferase family 2 protein [Loktanella sp. IMCC34160]|uniref:glycosyltransferase family 2 protein n=1 Tax=Loktanella sp. IMCC34160 TaxID=2510646 RepID=UPI00101C9FD7|nr:glycosyltransferase family 2 protein [Loktanella sp. IMCC34160]RYG91383.1 glycosyltransferase family 2 protein [Loktanella sp. IMCC34160]
METRTELWTAYKLRIKRRRLLFRALRKRGQLSVVANRTDQIAPGDILAAVTVRNEVARLPYFLEHYRRLGVAHFLFVDNGSDDGTRALLADQPDVSLWETGHSYRLSRFGLDWLTWLKARHAHGHWCLTLDADELLIYPHHDTRPLSALTEWLDRQGAEAMPAMMLDMYPRGPLGGQAYAAGQNPTEVLGWFDAGNYMIQRQEPLQNLWIQGGPRARMFFDDDPRRSPTLNKVPLIKWSRRYVYVNSTHAALPRRLNRTYAETGGEGISGLLLHTKFLPEVVAKSAEEKQRQEHFNNSALYDDYYDGLVAQPDLWCPHSTRFRGWRHCEALGLMSRGAWI